MKEFAHYREYADGQISEAGLSDYLVLLSVRLTCKYMGVSFLKFMLSRETDIDVFRDNAGKRKPLPTIELYPEGFQTPQSSRKRLKMASPEMLQPEEAIQTWEKTESGSVGDRPRVHREPREGNRGSSIPLPPA